MAVRTAGGLPGVGGELRHDGSCNNLDAVLPVMEGGLLLAATTSRPAAPPLLPSAERNAHKDRHCHDWHLGFAKFCGNYVIGPAIRSKMTPTDPPPQSRMSPSPHGAAYSPTHSLDRHIRRRLAPCSALLPRGFLAPKYVDELYFLLQINIRSLAS